MKHLKAYDVQDECFSEALESGYICHFLDFQIKKNNLELQSKSEL